MADTSTQHQATNKSFAERTAAGETGAAEARPKVALITGITGQVLICPRHVWHRT